MNDDQSGTISSSGGGGPAGGGGAGGKKARRGRRQDDSLPPSRSRDVQRAFRARRAAHLTHLESTVEWLQSENRALREKAGLPIDGPPLTGPAPVEEIVEGPADLPPMPVPSKKATGGSKGGRKNSKVIVAEDPSDAESQKMDDEYSPVPQDDARGAAEVLAARGGTAGSGISLPPMNVPSSSAAPPVVPHSTAQPLATYALPQQSSPRLQTAQAFQPHPSHLPYLVHAPHASVGYPSHPVPAYSSLQHYGNPYPQFAQNGPPQFNNFYPQPQQFPPTAQQNSHPHQPMNHNNGQNVFAMTMPPSNQTQSQNHQPPSYPSHRNSVSSAVTSPQGSTPPSSHVRVSTGPTATPLQQRHQPPHIYTALLPEPSSNFPSKSPNPAFPLKPITNPTLAPSQPQQEQQQPQQIVYTSMFPTPSPEDEQFFLDTFCGMSNDNMFLQSLYPPPEVYEIGTATATAATDDGTNTNDPSHIGPRPVDANEVIRKYRQGEGETRLQRNETEEISGRSGARSGGISSATSSPLPPGIEKNEFDAYNYKLFCIGLMKGVQGIEELIAARKRKRDIESEGGPGAGNNKRRRLGDGRRHEERQEKEDEAVAFLAEAAAMANKDRDCCEGIIDCGPPPPPAPVTNKTKEEECCGGLIDCGSTADDKKEVEKEEQGAGGEECCAGLISCDPDTQPPIRPKLIHADSLPPPPSTIHLPRSSSTTVSSCCGPKTACSLPSTSPHSDSDTYILVSVAFRELSSYMAPSQQQQQQQQQQQEQQQSRRTLLPPARIADLLWDNNNDGSKSESFPAAPTRSRTGANLIIVPPTPEEEERGRKGELYVRREVVERVKRWCEQEIGNTE